jgi:hypothetical protein
VHVSPIMHAVPHMPQFSLSTLVSTQAPEHSVLPIGQMIPHVPMLQPYIPPPGIMPASFPQIVPHFPQFVLSVFVSTHCAAFPNPHFV